VGDAASPLAINEVVTIPNISISPNPSTGIFTLDIANMPMQDLQISVYDVSGKQLLRISPTQARTQLDLSQQPAGVYAVHVCDAQFSYTSMLVKNK
jgi:hypothetical protein